MWDQRSGSQSGLGAGKAASTASGQEDKGKVKGKDEDAGTKDMYCARLLQALDYHDSPDE